MGLLECPDCKGKVSDIAPSCPHCGRPASSERLKGSAQPDGNPPTDEEPISSHDITFTPEEQKSFAGPLKGEALKEFIESEEMQKVMDDIAPKGIEVREPTMTESEREEMQKALGRTIAPRGIDVREPTMTESEQKREQFRTITLIVGGIIAFLTGMGLGEVKLDSEGLGVILGFLFLSAALYGINRLFGYHLDGTPSNRRDK